MSFLYFLPGHSAPPNGGTVELDFEPYGLSLSLGSEIKRAPDDATAYGITIEGVNGCLVIPHVNGAVPSQTTYQPAKQTWLWVNVGGPKVGIGWDKDNPPTPSALARKINYVGLGTTDASGNKWTIPTARSERRAVTLPSDFEFDPITLEAVPAPSTQFADLWRISGEIWDHFTPGGDFTLAPEVRARYALQALAVNYRVGPLELRALQAAGRKVLDNTSIDAFNLSLIDWPFFEEVKKKLQADESLSSGSGSEG